MKPVQDKILVFIPVYNCEQQIPRVLASFENKETARCFSEILVLDNGSRDESVSRAIQASKRITDVAVKIAKNHENYNFGGSAKAAFAYAIESGFTHIVILHGDDQGDIDDLMSVLKNQEHWRYDCCLGSRFMRGSRLTGYPRFMIIGNHIFNAIYSAVTRRRILDMGSGLNLYAVPFLKSGFYKKYTDGMHFCNNFVIGAAARESKIKFFPISWRNEDQRSNVRLFRQSLQTLGLALGYALAGNAFLARERRDKIRDAYPFDVLAAVKCDSENL